MIDKINQVVELNKELSKYGIINVTDSFGQVRAQLSNQSFNVMSNGKEVSETEVACDVYPHELSFEMGDIKFFTVMSFEDFYTYKHKKIAAATATKERIDI